MTSSVSKNDELCIKNKEFCIKNKRFCIKTRNFADGGSPTAAVLATRTALVASLPQCLPQKVGDGACDFE